MELRRHSLQGKNDQEGVRKNSDDEDSDKQNSSEDKRSKKKDLQLSHDLCQKSHQTFGAGQNWNH